MITLTTPVTLENPTRARVRAVPGTDDVGASVSLLVEVYRPSAGVYAAVILVLTNDVCERAAVNPSPIGYGDRIHKVRAIIPGALDRVRAIVDGAGTKAAKLLALEALGLADGWIGTGLSGSVT